MNKTIRFLFLFLLSGIFSLFFLSGCSQTVHEYYPTLDSVTVESILEVIDSTYLLEKYESYELVCVNEPSSEDAYDGYTVTVRCHKRDQFYLGNQMTEYDTGEYYHVFYSSEPADEKLYISSSEGCSALTLTDERLESMTQGNILNLENLDITISKRYYKDRYYRIELTCSSNGTMVEGHSLSIDPDNGLVMEDRVSYYEEDQVKASALITLNYKKDDIKIDKEPRYSFEHSGEKGSQMTFTTVDLEGSPVELSDFSDSRVLMIDFWEPWCDSCKEELPILEALYEKYKDQGLVILGVFSSFAMEDTARTMVQEARITYPILKWHASLQILAPEYKPAAVFLSSDGTVLSEEAVVGSQTLEEWEAIIETYLNSNS